MNHKKSSEKRRWLASFLACTGVFVSIVPAAEANNLYWRRYSPNTIGPGPAFISPGGRIWNGGWWMSVDVGRAPLSICRLSDGPSWVYGNYYDGLCAYYSPQFNRAHSVSLGFDLLGGNRFPDWRPISGRYVRPWSVTSSSGDPTLIQQQNVLDSELESLCRIQQAEGAFIGTLRDEVCYAAWGGQTLISGDYEVVEKPEN
jgi:hypothetical protein